MRNDLREKVQVNATNDGPTTIQLLQGPGFLINVKYFIFPFNEYRMGGSNAVSLLVYVWIIMVISNFCSIKKVSITRGQISKTREKLHLVAFLWTLYEIFLNVFSQSVCFLSKYDLLCHMKLTLKEPVSLMGKSPNDHPS